MWRFIRRWNPAGEDEKNDAAIDERRDYILEPRTALDQEQAKAGDGEHMDDDEVAVQARLEDYEAQLIEDKPLAEAENNDSEALLAVDAKALGTTIAAPRDLDITTSYVPILPRDTVPNVFRLIPRSLSLTDVNRAKRLHLQQASSLLSTKHRH